MTQIFEFPVYYQIHVNEETGQVKIYSKSKHAKGRELSQFLNPSGYLRVKMNNRSYEIHVLVTKFCIGERPKGLVVNHINGNKLDNRPSNLEYVTITENIHHAIRTGLHVSCDPTKMPSYKDGRTKDKIKYKHQWYLKNRDRVLQKVKERYYRIKDLPNVVD